MGSTWIPPGWHWPGETRFRWRQEFIWWPKRSEQSNKRIWLTKAWYGTRLVYGPAGEDPVRLEQWMTDEEYMWYRLTEQ